MPEAAVDKDRCLVPRENEVRLSRKCGSMKPVTEPLAVQGPSDSEFDRRVLTPDCGHVTASPGRRRSEFHISIVEVLGSMDNLPYKALCG